jgi:uncharacterized protein YecE (DUF72 family)
VSADSESVERATELASRAREPAISGKMLFGTAGWTDPSLVKSHLFYPRGVSNPQGRLGHYAKHFGLVEVDATYYTLLPPDMASRWVSWTPASFRFDVKAHPVLTGHAIDVARLPPDLREGLKAVSGEDVARVYPDKLPEELSGEIESRFRAFVETLRIAGRLGSVLVQFPPWFESTRGNARRIEDIARRWDGVLLAIEFRNKSWLEEERRERVFELLTAHRLSYVVVDEPDAHGGGVPAVCRVTNPDLAMVRFHGHNVAGWKRGATVAERFDYLYREGELRAWAEPLRRLSAEAKGVHAIFNNCVRNYAVLNAKGLSVIIDESTGPVPPVPANS